MADITCDSDGKVDKFIDLRDVKKTLELHDPGESPYYLASFLIGAYQEILGDLHNLFGDIHCTSSELNFTELDFACSAPRSAEHRVEFSVWLKNARLHFAVATKVQSFFHQSFD